jgi:hypothetical protein
MEGFWTVHFQGVQGWGTGVVTLVGGEIFGGDEGYIYMGTYAENAGAFSARIKVSKHAPGVLNVMGMEEFELEVKGLELVGATRQQSLHIEGRIPGSDQRLTGVLTKQRDLPARK